MQSLGARLVLGTAQLGMDYGIANRSGRPDEARALDLVRAAWRGGVRAFDTARDYGDAETVLGRCLTAMGVSAQARVVTKPDPGLDISLPGALEQSVRQSLDRLGVPRLHGLLLHRETLLDHWDAGLGESMRGLVRAGLVERIGVSVYAPAAALRALKADGLDLLQLPSGLLDRRFETAGVFEAAARRGVEVQVRSVFLQGLVFLDPDTLPPGMEHAREAVAGVARLAEETGLPRMALALAYVREALDPALVVFGAETPEQVRRNLEAWSVDAPAGLVERVRAAFPDVAETILNPVLWKQS